MLVYCPAFDIYHCLFRLFYIINILDSKNQYEIEKIQIIDFYLAYPGCIKEITIPADYRELKSEFKSITKEYRDPINKSQTFKKLNILQRKAINSMLSQGYLNIKSYKQGFIKRTSKEFPQELILKLNNFSFYENAKLPVILILLLIEIELNGNNGLKARTGLMEYRYANS